MSDERDPTEGSFTGDLNAYVDPSDSAAKTQRTPAVQDALRVDARAARKRAQQGRHRAQ